MNTTNTPDRDEVMPLKSILADLHIMLTHPESKLNEWERKAVASAKFLLEQDKEDGKARQELAEWLEFRRKDELRRKDDATEVVVKINHGAQAKAFVEALDYVRTHFPAMATTTEKGEG